MNVNPVAAPGHTSKGQVAAKAINQQIPTSSSDRGELRKRSAPVTAEAKINQATTLVDHNSQAISADRQKAEQLKAFISDDSVRLSTYHDEASGRSILEVRDQVTGDVVSQYPSEELIRLYAALRQPLVDQSA